MLRSTGRRNSLWKTGLLAGVLGTGVGCGGGEPATGAAGVSVRDSTGVRIVENRAPGWGETGGWRLDTVPRLTLGSTGLAGSGAAGSDGTGSDEVFFQEIVGVRLLGGGRLAVLDAGDATLRIFGADGVERERWGRFGEGPEEFQGPGALMALPEDTLVVWDAPSTSLVRIVPGRGFVARTPLIRVDGVQLRRPSMAADGRVLMPGFAWPAGSGEQDPGIYRGTAPVMVHAASGSSVDTLVLRPARQVLVAEIMGRSLVGDAPFAADLHAVWAGVGAVPGSDGAAVGDGTPVRAGRGEWQWQVDIVGVDGARQVWRGPAGGLELTEDDRDWYLEQLAARATSAQERAMLGQMERALTWPATRPAWSELRRDDTGHLWLRIGRHLPPTAASYRWRILSPEGRWLGDLELPPAFEPWHLTADAVVGVRTDGLGVQRVQVYGLQR